MKKILEKQRVFNSTLKFLSLLSKSSLSEILILPITSILAKINLLLNKPESKTDVTQLANSWKELMPPDGQNFYRVAKVDENTAFVEIHLKCPLKGTGKVDTCYKFMNYDRQLMKNIGGSLTVLESQSNSGKEYCALAIRKISESTNDLLPAHLKK